MPFHALPQGYFRLDDAFASLSAAARRTDPAPSPAQAEAGTYRKGRTTWQGLPVVIENALGSVREGTSPDGRTWRNVMAATYGEFAGTLGADGDPVDVFLGPAPELPSAWILNQRNPDGGFDEHKVLAGFVDQRHARDAYRTSYSPGWDRFDEPVPVTLAQLRAWLARGDMGRPFSTDLLPSETDMTETTDAAVYTLDDARPLDLPRIFWDSAAEPAAGMNFERMLAGLQAQDYGGLMFDPLTLAEVMEGERAGLLDGLVVMAGRLEPKMQAFMRIMNAASTDVQVLSVQHSDVVKRFGGAHVAFIFELSDGQTITVWFHNPDNTPKKFTPADDLVSWKWLLNKKDVTIVVAPERGEDLNIRDSARRLMKLAAKNSEKFAKANTKRAETMRVIKELKASIPEKQKVLADLHDQIEVAKSDKAEREKLKPEPKPAWQDPSADPGTTPGTEASDKYLRLFSAGEPALQYWQDALDHIFQGRIVDIRNALRELGWQGEKWAWPLTKDGASLDVDVQHTGAGKNIVGCVWTVSGNVKQGYGDGTRDDLSLTPAEFAAELDAAVKATEPVPSFLTEFDGGPFAALTEEQTGKGPKADMPISLVGAINTLRALARKGDAQGIDKFATDPANTKAWGDGARWVYEEVRALLAMMQDVANYKAPEPATFFVMLGDQSVSEHADIEAAAAAAKVVVENDPFAHEGVWVGDTEGNMVREIRPAGLGTPDPEPEPTPETDEERAARIKATPGAQRTDEDMAWYNARFRAAQQTAAEVEAARVEALRRERMGKVLDYLETIGDPKVRARAQSVLVDVVRMNGVTDFRHKAVEKYVAEGFVPGDEKGKPTLVMAGRVANAAGITKIGVDYAAWLIASGFGPAAPATTEDPSSPDLVYLREVNAGTHDGEDLGTLLSKISQAVLALKDANGLVGAADTAANDAITHWVELDQRVNG